MYEAALLALEDGSCYHGRSIGARGRSVGEIVFNTSMTGYQEILTDPSYRRQIVTFTMPHVGIVGVNAEDEESTCIHASGLVVRDLPHCTSNWRSKGTLGRYLEQQGVVAIAGVDTRALTRHLRDHGAQRACIVAGDDLDAEAAIAQARAFGGLEGLDLAREVSVKTRYEWADGTWRHPSSPSPAGTQGESLHVVAYDFGVKRNILRLLADRGCRLTVVPATTPADEVLALSPDGIFLSNGPGDPEPCVYAIEAIRAFLDAGVPLFGICLGHQLLALAAGARTGKMKFGHHGANHPVAEVATGRVLITSQNHGFAVVDEGLPETLEVTHRSLFDGSLQGIRHRQRPAFGFQGHPEASPGPHDAVGLFDEFVATMWSRR